MIGSSTKEIRLTEGIQPGNLAPKIHWQEQKINLENIETITVRYSSENIFVFRNDTNSFILKEFMNEDNSSYYARITSNGGNLSIEAGRRPFRLFDYSNRRIEIYIPVSNIDLTIKTFSGKIEVIDQILTSSINLESSSGNISTGSITANTVDFRASSGRITVDSITADTVNFRTSSGRIRCDNINGNTTIESNSGDIVFGIINGDIFAQSSSGDIELGLADGAINIKTSSGSVRCTITENARDILIATSSGRVFLNIPRSSSFNFSSRSSTGRLRTPFNDMLSSPLSDRNLFRGTIGTGDISENQSINITTSSGSINVDWAD
jgi:DUF4097 and DUF4098 domain-containing protein YvlB